MITFQDFINEKETSSFQPPEHVIEPAKDDKIFYSLRKNNRQYKYNFRQGLKNFSKFVLDF